MTSSHESFLSTLLFMSGPLGRWRGSDDTRRSTTYISSLKQEDNLEHQEKVVHPIRFLYIDQHTIQ